MFFARRIALLRLVTLIGLGASAALAADSLHAGRAFCPLEAACNKAKESALGEIAGIPTSILGIMAFTGMFAVSLLPPAWSRKLLRPAGILAAIAGQGFIVYQAFVLESFCPLCLVADFAGILAAVVVLTWPPVPVYLSGKVLRGDSSRTRAAWALAVMAAVFVPIGWPRSQEPAWVEITPLADEDLEFAAAPPAAVEPEAVQTSPARTPKRTRPAGIHLPGDLVISLAPGQLPPPTATGMSGFPEPGTRARARRPRRAPAHAVPAMHAPDAPEPAAPTPSTTHRSTPPERTRPAPRAPKPAPRRPVASEPTAEVRIVEYLNAYCAHCRATHRRLDLVLARTKAPVKRKRIYTWASDDYPLWARACAYAGTVGLEDRMFEELMKARSQAPGEVYAAAKRAGLDLDALKRAVREPTPPPRLVHDKKLQRAAGLRGLPTLDIGRRRLMGEQTEVELSAAVRAALRPTSS